MESSSRAEGPREQGQDPCDALWPLRRGCPSSVEPQPVTARTATATALQPGHGALGPKVPPEPLRDSPQT